MRRRRVWWIPLVLVLAAVAAVLWLTRRAQWWSEEFWRDEFFPWLGSWFIPWAQTPGFGGAAAVVAATIAFSAARHQARVQRESQRKEQWWKRAEWALNLTLDDRAEVRTVGYRTLSALAASEWASEHEGDVIAAATSKSLDDQLVDAILQDEMKLAGDDVVSGSGEGDNEARAEGE